MYGSVGARGREIWGDIRRGTCESSGWGAMISVRNGMEGKEMG